jgi:ribonucleoside-diphosphate reductase alpha chain
MSTNIYERL